MLADDLRDLPADLLERAISDWALRSPYMPKAFDLIQLAKSYLPKPAVSTGAKTDWERRAQDANDALAAREKGRRDIRWVPIFDGMKLEFDPNYRSKFDRFVDRLDDGAASQGEVDDAPEHWRKIAEERGCLRQMDDGRFVIRERRSILPGL